MQPFPRSYSHLIATIHHNILRLPRGEVHFQWIPSHSGIQGNEAADRIAKQAATSDDPLADIPFEYSELKSIVQKGAWNFWQAKWTSIRGQFALGTIKPSVRPWSLRKLQTRRNETLFARLRLGTAPLNKALYQIRQAPSPLCPSCNTPETSHHYLISCTEFEEAREQLRRQVNSHGVLTLSTASLLGGDTSNCPAWPHICKAVEEFIGKTHRFQP
ncbi:uncharacterized protein LOC108673383 [Hyalella azteca]|uniref:Uncharacterized protein LOC108673383 n=1 Tax=Hyalella azteca TaxID=294128 RepID=A0A8B7NUP1_HYAAZ|nr:uncharacterized protein LOC108673383 [Hyalella azteca]